MMGLWTKCGNPQCVMVTGHPGPCAITTFSGVGTGPFIDAADAPIAALKADHDAHRRQLQARNTELVEENRRLRARLAEVGDVARSMCRVIVTDEHGLPVGRCKMIGPHSVHRTP